MKNYQQKECCHHHDSRAAKERYIKPTLHSDAKKNRPPNKTKKDNSFNSIENQRKVTSSLINPRGRACDGNLPPLSKGPGHGHIQNELSRPTHNHDAILRPSSCTCPHGHHYDEEIRPASCPYGHKHERKQPRVSFTCSYGSTINQYPRPLPINKHKPAMERKRKFYSINVPQEPLIQMPMPIISQNHKDNGQEMQPRSTPNSQRKKIVPFCKSYKNGKVYIYIYYIMSITDKHIGMYLKKIDKYPTYYF